MNTIHNSSLAFNPVAYHKQQQEPVDVNPSAVIPAVNQVGPITSGNPQIAQPSSADHIHEVLTQTGLTSLKTNTLAPNTFAQRAVNAYNQTHKLATQLKITELISGIDIYV